MALSAYTVFIVRRPVVVVTDAPFEELYGPRRAELQRRLASLRLFRRIIAAQVADSATPLAAADAAAAAAPRPACVVFPSRYEVGAVSFVERFAEVPAVIVGDGHASSNNEGTELQLRLHLDKGTDLYRAGRIAGLLCAEGGRPLIFTESTANYLGAFAEGLSDSAFIGEPIVLPPGAPPPSTTKIACVIAVDPASRRLPPELQGIPAVLFSWIDPDLVPSGTVAVFDDSVWATLVYAVRKALGGPSKLTPSTVWFPADLGKKASRKIRAAATARYEVHNSL
jgi:hypothetical protein